MEEDQGTPYAQNVIEEKNKYADAGRQNLALNPEMNRGPGYHTYHRTCSHLQRTKRVGQMDDSTYKVKIVHKGVLLQNLKGPPIRRSRF